MKSAWIPAFVALLAFPGAVIAAAEWVHVEIRESDRRSASVVINLPLSSLARAIPLLPESRLRSSRVQIGEARIGERQLRTIIASLLSTGKASCDCEGERITAVVEGEWVRFDVEEKWGDGRISAMIPLGVVRALGGRGPGLDYLAALRAVASQGGGELALVTADDANVRIWLDDLAEPLPSR